MRRGSIEVIAGGMFSGKSEELVRRLRRAVIARDWVVAIKHVADDRYHASHIVSHTGTLFEALPAATSEMVEAHVPDGAQVVGIDEAQFFDMGLVGVCERLAQQVLRVVVAGLDMDSDGRPFGPMPQLLAIAEEVTKLRAVCVICGGAASMSYHKGQKTSQVEVGVDQYEARCRPCSRLR